MTHEVTLRTRHLVRKVLKIKLTLQSDNLMGSWADYCLRL